MQPIAKGHAGRVFADGTDDDTFTAKLCGMKREIRRRSTRQVAVREQIPD
jgi:hypothetical protein